MKYPCEDHLQLCLIAANQIDYGVRSLSACAKSQGISTAIGFFNTPDKLYTAAELDAILAWIARLQPTVVGISTIQCSRQKVLQLLTALRSHWPCRTVVGGIDATNNPDEYLGPAEFIIRGEADLVLPQLAHALLEQLDLKDIPNLVYRRDGQVVNNPMSPLIQQLDSLPFPDWLDIDNHYMLLESKVCRKQTVTNQFDHPILRHLRNSMHFMTMRGCAFRCHYCVNHMLTSLYKGERYVRRRSVDPVINRMKQIQAEVPQLDFVIFSEDDFFLRPLDELSHFAARWKTEIKLPFYAFCTPNSLQEDKLSLLIDAGLHVVNMGIQTGSDSINRNLYNRAMTSDRVRSAAHLLSSMVGKGPYGFSPPWYDLIINNPYEKDDDLLQTLKLCQDLPKPSVMYMHSIEFFTGTVLHQKAVADGLIQGEDAMAHYSVHDTQHHLRRLRSVGGAYYLNSLLYWMDGPHTSKRYGILPASLLPWLLHPRTRAAFTKNPWLIDLLNAILPTEKRVFFLKQKWLRKLASRRKPFLASRAESTRAEGAFTP